MYTPKMSLLEKTAYHYLVEQLKHCDLTMSFRDCMYFKRAFEGWDRRWILWTPWK